MYELLRSAPKKYASRYFQLKVGMVNWDVPGQNRGQRNPHVLVVRAKRANCRALVHKVAEVEKTKEEASKKLKRKKC